MELSERLWDHVVTMPNGCMEWTGYVNAKGYGNLFIEGKTVKAHRLAWALAYGPIAQGDVIRHFVCDNPPCCNVAHLRSGTQADNINDMNTKGRNGHTAKTHCPDNHAYDEVNTYVSPSGKRVCRICTRNAQGRYRMKKRTG